MREAPAPCTASSGREPAHVIPSSVSQPGTPSQPSADDCRIPLVEVLRLSPPTPSAHLDIGTRGGPDRHRSPRAEDILGSPMVRFTPCCQATDIRSPMLRKAPPRVMRSSQRPNIATNMHFVRHRREASMPPRDARSRHLFTHIGSWLI